MIVSVDPSRAADSELAEGEIGRLTQLAARFSREDLMRAFDLLAKTEYEIRSAPHPRHHFEMALLRWMHLRKLVPLTSLLEQLGRDAGSGGVPRGGAAPGNAAVREAVAPRASSRPVSTAPAGPSLSKAPPVGATRRAAVDTGARPEASAAGPNVSPEAPPAALGGGVAGLKDALLAEIRAGKSLFYNTVVAQAQSIDVTGDRVAFAFLPTHRAMREQFEQSRVWIEAAAERIAGRKITVVAVQAAVAGAPHVDEPTPVEHGKRDLRAQALSSPVVQAVLDVFPAEIRDVEEI
jgi:DNA polymerase-3 subunit gamma/tau